MIVSRYIYPQSPPVELCPTEGGNQRQAMVRGELLEALRGREGGRETKGGRKEGREGGREGWRQREGGRETKGGREGERREELREQESEKTG